MKRLGVAIILLLAFLGLSDSLYLRMHEMSGTPLLCDIESLSGCNTVAASAYSNLFGIPLATFGVAFYALLFVVAALELVLFNQLLRRIIQGLAGVGILFSLYFTFLQAFVIEAFCIYCLASAIITFFILLCASTIEPLRKSVRTDTRTSSQLPMPPIIS